MAYLHTLAILVTTASVVSGGERLFTSGPQEFAGQRYYWLAEWKLEVTLPDDTAADDRLEVLFGTKGSGRRTLYFEYDGKSGSIAHAGSTKILSGKSLSEGFPVRLETGTPLRLAVRRQ